MNDLFDTQALRSSAISAYKEGEREWHKTSQSCQILNCAYGNYESLLFKASGASKKQKSSRQVSEKLSCLDARHDVPMMDDGGEKRKRMSNLRD